MKILFVGYMYGRGGIQTHTHFLASGLSEIGHEVVVATPAPMHDHSRAPAYGTDAGYELLEYRGVHGALKMFGGLSGRRFDLVQVCGTGWAAMVGALTARGAQARVFFEVMSGEQFRRLDPRWAVHLGFDAVVGQAKPVEETFCQKFHWSRLRTTIPALPEPLERRHAIARRRELKASPDGRFGAVYFGRIAAHKGLSHLVENWPELSRALRSVHIYGSGPDEDALRGAIAARDLQDVLVLKGQYPAGLDYVALMQRYDVELLPTEGAEGAPLVLLEAMASGLPFVANGVGGIPDYHNEDCEITTGNIRDFVPAVLRWAERARVGDITPARLQAHYTEKFSYARLTERWDAFFKEIIGKTPEVAATVNTDGME
jgi:glycosyltransferase involved in cell wall biosynthesis